jgi:hypothetical protein
VFRGYFPSSEVETLVEQWSYDVTQMIGEMGGSIGLFLGFSFLSIYSGIEIVCMAIAAAIYRAKPISKRGDLAWIKGNRGVSVNHHDFSLFGDEH